MLLSIIIVNYKTGPLTQMLVESLLAQMEDSGGRLTLHDNPVPRDKGVEIIVVDNDSQDDSVHLLRSDFPEVTVLETGKNLGLAGGVNVGLRAAKGQYYLILNPDIIAPLGSLSALLRYMEKNQRVGLAGGKLLSPNGDLQQSCARFYRPMTIVYRRTPLSKTSWGKQELDRFMMSDYDRQTAQAVDWLQGSCMMARARAVQQVGLWDERFFLYFEDVDWCRRFWEAGSRVAYVPDAQFSHFHQRRSDRGSLFGIISNWATREHIKSAAKYFWKYRGKLLPRSV